jgi:hypothetical protein
MQWSPAKIASQPLIKHETNHCTIYAEKRKVVIYGALWAARKKMQMLREWIKSTNSNPQADAL